MEIKTELEVRKTLLEARCAACLESGILTLEDGTTIDFNTLVLLPVEMVEVLDAEWDISDSDDPVYLEDTPSHRELLRAVEAHWYGAEVAAKFESPEAIDGQLEVGRALLRFYLWSALSRLVKEGKEDHEN